MKKKYIFHLSAAERELLHQVIKRQLGTSMKVRRAQIMLKADASGPNWTDAQIAEAFNCQQTTVSRLRERVVECGVELALKNQKEGVPGIRRTLSGELEARIIAERLSDPPAGYSKWTLRLLADHVVALGLVESVSYETIRSVLKKMR